MANPKLEIRLPRIMHKYLDDLANIGYGKDKTAVARRYIENAVTAALETKVIPTRNAEDFEEEDHED